MRIAIRGTTYGGDTFEVARDFEYSFEIASILQDLSQWAEFVEFKFSPDVDAAEAEHVMAAVVGASWKDGVCKSAAGAITRLTTSGGRA